ncbi:hypothetical protein HMPREF0653_02519 [Prevotella disiens JCM 6334 = ATCC 29426]|uniref:Transposase n=1 Tax=Prevotella disiens JCM 6334 = ATCC 29426 TaxID=1235811 RepID=A0ABN0NP10_9BACT|nr:hypothetical protein HMPREF0653_02519 [Prevotella disiens JCM 6334 = ATCC 29426]
MPIRSEKSYFGERINGFFRLIFIRFSLLSRSAQANTDIFFAVRNVIRVVELAKKSRPYMPKNRARAI